MTKKLTLLFCSVATVTLLSACGSSSKQAKAPLYTPTEEILLQQFESTYHDGKYNALIRQIRETPETELGGIAFRSEALKYKAFSECMVRQRTNCRNTFRKLLEINPEFNLTAAEANHPSWGTTFEAEKKRAEAQQARAQQAEGLEAAASMPRSEIRVGPRQRAQ